MLQQVFLDSRYADFSYATGYQVHWLADPLVKPEGYYLNVHILSAWIPLTYYNVHSGNNVLDIQYSIPFTNQRIVIPEGNRDVDFLVEYVNERLLFGCEVSYDASTNKLFFTKGDTTLYFTYETTAWDLLGLNRNPILVSPFQAPRGVDMTRTSSILLRSNLHGTNRDPYTKRMSDILCKKPVSHQQPNEIIEYTQPAFVRITNPSITHFTIGLFDDDGRYLDLNGNRWTVTIQVSLERDDNHVPGIPRYLSNEPEPDSPREPEGKPKNQAGG